MKNGNKYNVIRVNSDGTVRKDSKVYKTLDGVVRRLEQLVQYEDMQLRAGFGEAHEYRIARA